MMPYSFTYNDEIVLSHGETEVQAASLWFLRQPLHDHLVNESLVLHSQLVPSRAYTCVLSGDVTMHFDEASTNQGGEDSE